MNPNDQLASAVSATINLTADGKQHGFLALPHSSNESAWGSIRIPITVIKNGEGPTITLIGGSHGDEYEGPVTIMHLANELEPAQLNGRLILIPCLNMPAVAAATRLSPIDQLNMNRVFPGRVNGSPTERIADYVSNHIIAVSDIVLDLHAGGKTLNFIPLAAVHFLADRELQQRAESLMIAFGAPNCLRMRELDDRGMLDTMVEKAGKVFVTTELGGGGSATRHSLEIAYTGCRNVLSQAGLLNEEIALRATRMLEMPDDRCFVIAEDAGLLAMSAELGQEVYQGDVIASIYPIDRTGVQPVSYRASRNGVLMARHHPGVIAAGDCLAVIAEEVQR